MRKELLKDSNIRHLYLDDFFGLDISLDSNVLDFFVVSCFGYYNTYSDAPLIENLDEQLRGYLAEYTNFVQQCRGRKDKAVASRMANSIRTLYPIKLVTLSDLKYVVENERCQRGFGNASLKQLNDMSRAE